LNRDGLTVVMVTHNLELAQKHTHRTIRMQYGRILGGDQFPRPEDSHV
jgi:ABC-type ATPase involved in cell division